MPGLEEDPATQNIKVVMFTALSQESDRREAIEAGAEDYFPKPFNSTTLFEKVEGVLESG